jgi:hypothetical protein
MDGFAHQAYGGFTTDLLLDFFNGFVNSVVRPVSFCGNFFYRPAQQKKIFRDGQLRYVEFVAVVQAEDILSFEQQTAELVYSSSNARDVNACQPAYLPTAVGIVQVHCHQQLIFFRQQVHPSSQHLDSVAMLGLCVQSLLREVIVYFPHLQTPQLRTANVFFVALEPLYRHLLVYLLYFYVTLSEF